MIKVLGYNNGKHYADAMGNPVQISIKECAAMFGVSLPSGGTSFRLLPSKIKKDPDGRPRHQKARGLPAKIVGMYQGEEIQIEFLGGSFQKGRYLFRGSEHFVDQGEEYLFLRLSPYCRGGVFSANNIPIIYSEYDKVATASSRLDAFKVRREVEDRVMSMDGSLAIVFAKGIIYNGAQIVSSVDVTVQESVSALLTLAGRDASWLGQQLDDASVEARGLILHAIDTNVIRKETNGNGKSRFIYVLDNKEIVEGYDSEVEQRMIAFINSNLPAFRDRVYGTKGVDYLSDAIAAGIVKKIDVSVLLLDKSGTKVGNALISDAGADWVESLRNNSIAMGRIKKQLNA